MGNAEARINKENIKFYEPLGTDHFGTNIRNRQKQIEKSSKI